MRGLMVDLSPLADRRLRALAAAGHRSLRMVVEDAIALLHWQVCLDESEPFNTIDLIIENYPDYPASKVPPKEGEEDG